MEEFIALINKIISSHSLIQLHLNTPKIKSNEIPTKIVVRPWKDNAGALKYQMTLFYATKSIDRHVEGDALADETAELLGNTFKQALIWTQEGDYHILVSKKNKVTILKKRPSKSSGLQLSHNQPKNYLLQEGEPIPFLVALGVMNEDGRVKASMYDKFKQINRYLETVADLLPVLKEGISKGSRLHIVDFGCGKSYLTFALYHYLVNLLKLPTHIVGLDLKKEVIDRCMLLAKQLGFDQLQFIVGDVNNYHSEGAVDMVISLHACDTATDVAIAKAIKWETRVILAVPCCQHELRDQIDNKMLRPLLKHGILHERFAAMVTDALRAQLLEIAGYRTDIVEFIDMEHTKKNILIKAIKHGAKATETQIEEYRLLLNAMGDPSFTCQRLLNLL